MTSKFTDFIFKDVLWGDYVNTRTNSTICVKSKKLKLSLSTPQRHIAGVEV